MSRSATNVLSGGRMIFRRLFAASISAALCGFVLLLAGADAAHARGHGHRNSGGDRPGHFDYYLVSLSWSPTFCELHPDEAQQCNHKGYGFVLHGVWPQNRNGTWPQHCSTDSTPDEQTITHAMAIMPSRHLVEHEWETHGSCSGLGAKAYFDLADDAFSRIAIPDALKAPKSDPGLSAADVIQAFEDKNPGLEDGMISVACRDGSELEEVRICVDKDNLSVKACGGRVRNSCKLGKLKIPATN